MRKEPIKLWNGDILIAEQSEENPMKVVLVNKDVQRPTDLFKSEDVTEIPTSRLVRWAEQRVFPEERCGADELLEELGLKKYEAKVIASLTNAALFGDDYYVTGIIARPSDYWRSSIICSD